MMSMNPSRRAILGLISAGMILPASLVQAQSETARIQREIDEATARGKPWLAPPASLVVSDLRLPDRAHLIGIPGRSRLVLSGNTLAVTSRAARITLEGISFDGAQRTAGRDKGLLQLRDVADLRISDCTFERFGGNGLSLERCGGRISGSSFRDNGRAALFAIDSRGLSIEGNVVERSGENGILVWRSAKGDDATMIRGNRIQDIRADAGGTGEYGNAIGLYRAGGVIAEGNNIRRVAYSAVRNNGGNNVSVANNNIAACGEAAVFIEFAFDGVVITGNVIDGAMLGLSVANFADHQGRLSAITGNLIRNLRAGRHPGDGKHVGGQGIFVEGDAAITGNVIEGAQRAGMQLGWGPSLRDVTASGNTIRDCGNGIEISVAPGAGRAIVIGNTLAAIRNQAIVGMQWHKQVTGDLAITGAKDWPGIHLGDNMVR
jgi:uncharacterized secreted repeat protein (TIGR03808 family)